jgi:hypothetical protein
MKQQLYWVKVRRILRQVAQACTDSLDRLFQRDLAKKPFPFVNRLFQEPATSNRFDPLPNDTRPNMRQSYRDYHDMAEAQRSTRQ